MKIATLGDIRVHHAVEGDPEGAPVLFANALGTDLRLWDDVLPLLPAGLRLIRHDQRGHGLTDLPGRPCRMDDLVTDAEGLLDHLEVRGAVVVGLSIGGLVALGLAARRPDLVRALVLSNTAARIGTPAMWQERMALLRRGGIAALADATMERWFTPAFRATPALTIWRNMLIRQPLEGYIGGCEAIARADLRDVAARLDLPALAIAASHDGSTPPDAVRETAALIPGCRLALIPDAGHLPPVEAPAAFARLLSGFLHDVGHV